MLESLDASAVEALIAQLLPFVWQAVIAIAVLTIGWIASRWAERLLLRSFQRGRIELAVARFLSSIGRYAVLAAAVIAALGAAGVETTSLVAMLASAGLAVGLALQGSLSNFASGVMIVFLRPFSLNDVITAGGHTGRVDDIGLFSTALLLPDNARVIIPNSALTNSVIVNLTAMGTRRVEIDVGVAYGSDVAKAQAALLRAAASTPAVLPDPAAEVFFFGLGASSLDFKLRAWCNAPDFGAVTNGLREAVYRELAADGIEIPFPQVVVHGMPTPQLAAVG